MKRIKLLLLLILFSCYAHAQENSNDILNKLNGNWSAKGAAFGMPATITMSWLPALEGKFHQLNYKMLMTGKDGNLMVFEGAAFYKRLSENSFTATWFDSQGNMHPITASSDATTLTSLWGTPETQQGKTTYRFVSNNEVEVTDYVMKKDGTWSKFNQNTLARDKD
ncbi:MAG: DUF1579 family protein [Cyclobacteriaceae bacterium]|nr:DUF1579 family protein [Cyclobacteriaceae bacterium]